MCVHNIFDSRIIIPTIFFSFFKYISNNVYVFQCLNRSFKFEMWCLNSPWQMHINVFIVFNCRYFLHFHSNKSTYDHNASSWNLFIKNRLNFKYCVQLLLRLISYYSFIFRTIVLHTINLYIDRRNWKIINCKRFHYEVELELNDAPNIYHTVI